MSSSPSSSVSDYVIPARLWGWVGTPRALAALVWLVTFAVAGMFLYRAFEWFENAPNLPTERHRADGNGGHAQIDFGGQWLMGRMVATGNGRDLYHRQRQWQVLRAAYKDDAEAPAQRTGPLVPRHLASAEHPQDSIPHDADNLMGWFMGTDPAKEWKTVGGAAAAPLAQPPTGNPFVALALEAHAADTVTAEVVAKVNEPAVGGPLYPPVHALFYAPLGFVENPRHAYRAFQVFSLFVIFLTGLGVKLLTDGRVWWSVATLCVLLFPGTRGALDLGQNPALSLCILVWGWALVRRGYPVAGGMVWGLLAFKPVWGLAFFLVPLLMRRWRFCAAMALTGAALGALTLPLVGLESWFEWLKVGRDASELYKVNDNWIHLSRDLHGIPRRVLHDFTKPERERETALANALAWGLWAVVFGGTTLVYLWRGNRAHATGLSAGFLFLGAYLTCYRFMYYDVLLAAAAVAVLFADPRWFLRTRAFELSPGDTDPRVPLGRELAPPPAVPNAFGARMLGYVNSFPLTIVALLFVLENSLSGLHLEATVGFGYFATPATDLAGSAVTPRVKGDTGPKYPTDTFLLLALWAWCGWRVLRGDERRADFLVAPVSRPVKGHARYASAVRAYRGTGLETGTTGKRRPLLSPERVQRGADVVGAHQRFAHQHRPRAGRAEPHQVRVRLDSALAHHHAVERYLRQQLQRVLQSRHECPQVAVVDAHDRRAAVEHAGQFVGVVQLHQRVKPERDRLLLKLREPAARQALGDEQHRVRAGAAGFEQLVAVEDEIFP